MSSLFNPLRITIPFLADVIYISDPEQIRKIEGSGDVDRLHAYGTKALPFWVRTFFKATRFCDSERDQWFLSLESDNHPDIRRRRASLAAKIGEGYSDNDVKKIAGLLIAKADNETLAYAMTQVVNQRFFGEDVPKPIMKAAGQTLQRLPETIVLWKYRRARAAQKKIMAYCERKFGPEAHLVDVGHNIGETVQTASVAVRRLKTADLRKSVEKIFTQRALTTQVPRIATKATDFDGLLRAPTSPGKTVLIYQIEKAARKTEDISFVFGAGIDHRECVFKDFFLAFMEDLQKELRKGTPTKPAHNEQ